MNDNDNSRVNDFGDNYSDGNHDDYRNLDQNIKDDDNKNSNVPVDPLDDFEIAPSTDEDTEEEQEEQEERPSKKYSVQEAFQIAQREKYNAIAELERVRQENARLKATADQSAEAALIHYEENVNNRLRRATAMFEVAEENGDVRAKASAIQEMNDARSEANELNRWKADQQSNYKEQYQQPKQQYQPDPYQGHVQQPQQVHSTREMAAQAAANGHNWIAKNSWFYEGSKDYDPELSAIARDISSKMDQEAIRIGHPDVIGSPRYLQELDYHLNQVRGQHNRGSSVQIQNRGLNMKQSRSPVSSVRNGVAGSNSYNKKMQVRLSPDQAEFARLNKFDKNQTQDFMRKILASQQKNNSNR